jgi:DNA-binding response OmpR family regulator
MGKIRTLIAEDDEDIHALYKKALSGDMFEMLFRTNGKEALEAYLSWKPDLIILDILMPIITGYDLLKEIRLNLKDKSTAVIMSTSLSKKDDIKDCLKLGVQGYIIKPFNHKEVGNKIIRYFQEAATKKPSDRPG